MVSRNSFIENYGHFRSVELWDEELHSTEILKPWNPGIKSPLLEHIWLTRKSSLELVLDFQDLFILSETGKIISTVGSREIQI